MNDLQIVIPYGNANSQNHFAYGNKEGDVTLCGRDCYGWSIPRRFEGADMDSAYSCKACIKGAVKMIPHQDPRLPAKLPHLIGAMNLVGPRGLCFHRAVALVLDVGPPNPASLVIARVREANEAERAAMGDEASPTPFIHAWCEWRGEVFAPSLIERNGGLFPVDREQYYFYNGVKVLATMTRGQIKALDREFGFSAHLRKFRPLRGGASFGAVLLERAGVPWSLNEQGGVEAID